MVRRTRIGALTLVGTVSVPVVIAGMAWACGPSGYGTPESPAPPVATVAPSTPPTSNTPPPTGSGPAQPPPVQVTVESGSSTTSGAGQSGRSGPVAQSPALSQGRSVVPPTARADLSTRVAGGTAGVVESRGQTVFRSSTAPKAKAGSRAKAKARPAPASAPAVSERAATGDLWGGLATADANLASAAALNKDEGGLSGGLTAALVILGLGLAGLTGGALATAGRRRRAGAAKRQ